MTPMWQVVLSVIGIMVSLAVLGIAVESKKRDNFREYWWARLSAWAGANADAHHYRKDRHDMYRAVWMSRVNHKDGELEPWGASAPRVSEMHLNVANLKDCPACKTIKSQAMEIR